MLVPEFLVMMVHAPRAVDLVANSELALVYRRSDLLSPLSGATHIRRPRYDETKLQRNAT
jgi:hypothetical protein